MRRTDRYLLSEMLLPAAIGGLMVLMLLIGNELYKLFVLLYSGAPGRDVVRILVLLLPAVFMQALPGALLLGTALALTRLERDRELMSMRMAGVRLLRLVAPILIVGVLASGVLFALQEIVVPKTTHEAMGLMRKLAWGTPTAVVPRDTVFKIGRDFLYVHEIDPDTQTLRNVIACKIDGGTITWLTIPVAENRDGHWFLKHDPITNEPPKMYMFRRGSDPLYGEIEGRDAWLNLKQDTFDFMTDQVTSPAELTLAELRALQSNVRGYTMGYGMSLSPRHLTFHLHRKFATPLAALVAILIAIPLSVHFGRSGGYMGLLLSVSLAFVFVVANQWATVLAETNRLDPVFAAWAPNAFFGLLGLVLLIREE